MRQFLPPLTQWIPWRGFCGIQCFLSTILLFIRTFLRFVHSPVFSPSQMVLAPRSVQAKMPIRLFVLVPIQDTTLLTEVSKTVLDLC